MLESIEPIKVKVAKVHGAQYPYLVKMMEEARKSEPDHCYIGLLFCEWADSMEITKRETAHG